MYKINEYNLGNKYNTKNVNLQYLVYFNSSSFVHHG